MDFGEVLDTSFGRLRIQLSAVFFIISRVLAIFLAWLYTWEILIPVHARELGVEKFSRHMYFKQYFTRYEFIKGNFKPHLTLPFCKIHMSRISLSLNHAMRINSLQFFNILILDYVVSACQFVY